MPEVKEKKITAIHEAGHALIQEREALLGIDRRDGLLPHVYWLPSRY